METLSKLGKGIAFVATFGLVIYVFFHLILGHYHELNPSPPQVETVRTQVVAAPVKVSFSAEKMEWSPRLRADEPFKADEVAGREVRYDGDDKQVYPWPLKTYYEVPRSVKYIQIRSTEKRMYGSGIGYEK